MKKIIFYFLLLFYLLISDSIVFAQGDFPLRLFLRLTTPYPTHLSDFTDYEDRIFIDVFNSSSETYQIILTGRLENESRGIAVKTNPTNPPMHEIMIFPGNNTVTGSDLTDLFNPDHLIFQGISEARIRADEALPEGEYVLCIRAFDILTPGRALSPDPELFISGCTQYNLSYIDPPQIISPVNDAWVDPTSPVIPIQWTWNRPAFGSENVSFALRIVEIDPAGRDPNDVLLSSATPDLFFEEGIFETFYNLSIPDEVTFENGKSYVIQVIATDDTGELAFKNNGRSEPCVFGYRESSLTIGRPMWETEQGISFESASEVEFSYRIPVPEDFEIILARDIYVFEIPEGVSPEDAHDRAMRGGSGPDGEFFVESFIEPWSETHNPTSLIPGDIDHFEYGQKYGIVMEINPDDPDHADHIHFENDGRSEILVFHYGTSITIGRPMWETEQGISFESASEVEFSYRIPVPEDFEIILARDIYVFEIPEGVSPEDAHDRAMRGGSGPDGEFFVESFIEPWSETHNPTSLIPGDIDHFEYGQKYGIVMEINPDDPDRADHIHFENDGRSEILTFTIASASSSTDIVLLYPGAGERIPFSFFPLVARYTPFNDQYQHWKSRVSLSKDGVADDFFNIDGFRWPGGSQAAQRTLVGLSDITEDESQNIAVYKNNSQRTEPFERGANYRWETNVKLYYDVAGTGSFLEYDKSSTFSRGMGPSQLMQPGWGAVIAPDSTFNFRWITAEAPEKLFPVNINHATRRSIAYFNGRVDEKWVLEVSNSESFDTILYQIDGTVGNGMDYLSGEFTEEQVFNELYKELTSAEAFTPSLEGYHYWRVKWLMNPGGTNDSEHYVSSQIRPFWVGDSPPPELTTRRAPPEDCISECLVPEITNTTTISSLAPGSVVQVGDFQMTVNEVTGSSRSSFTGTGEIRVSFLNNIRVNVSFEDISINTAMELIRGDIVADNDVPSISMDTTGIMIGGQRVVVPSMSDAESEALNAAITSSERLVSFLTDSRPIGMPIGLDNEIDGVNYVIGITEMTFQPRRAKLTAVMRLDIPSLGNHIPALGAKNVCFTPGGLGDEGRLYLHRDWTITPDDIDIQFSFSGVESGDTTQATYVEWDCQGFKCMSIRGEVEFPTDLIVEEDPSGNILPGEHVTADFGVKTCRGANWIAEIGIEPFQIKGMNGWGFSSSRAYLDFSDIENPPSMIFPENYDTSYLSVVSPEPSSGGTGAEDDESLRGRSSDRLRNSWRGFYLTELTAHVPPDFEDEVAGRPSFGIRNMIIDFVDGGGVTVSVVGEDIIDYESGSVDNLAFSLDSVGISIVQSSIFEGGLKGKIGLPIFEEDDYLNYEGLIVYEADTLGINFNVNVTDTLDVPMWQANLFLAPESVIGMTHQSGSAGARTTVYADLTGGMDITGDLASATGSVPGVNFKGIRFEHLVYNSNGPTFHVANFYVTYASEQKSAAGFPVNINDIGIDISLPRAGITFDFTLTLSDAGFSAEAGFGIYGLLGLSGDREIFSFDGIELRSIEIHQQCSGVRLDGRLDFYDDDATFGDGLRGYVHAVLPMDLEGSLTVQFGTKKTPGIENPAFNSRDYFPYWYVDGMIRIPDGITIFSGFAIYGFGGGAYYRMRPDFSALTSTSSLFGEESADPSSGVRYIPDWATLGGFKILAILGTQPSEKAFNMDVTIDMNFTESGGIGLFSIDGAGYVMASFEQRPEAKIRATVHFAYVNPGDGSERVEGNFAVYVDYEDILHGAEEGNRFVYAEFLVQDDIWYYYMGKPDHRGGLDLQVIEVHLDSYLMIGHGIPRRLPPLPDFIANLVYGPGQRELNSGTVNPSTIESRQRSGLDEIKMSNARGFAFGSSFHVNTRFEFAIFYAELEAMFGFDVLVTEDPSRTCFESGLSPGINNWYAMGQMYAGLRGEMGVFVDLFFIEGEFPIIELAAAVAMRGGLPNPSWVEGRAGLHYRILNGLVEGQCNFKIQLGEKCSVVDENPLSSIEFIADIYPADGSSDVTVFATPAVSFNLPVNRLLELPAGLDEEPDNVRIFRPYIERFTLADVQDRETSITGSFELNETNTIASFVFTDPEAFEAYNRFKVQIIVQAYEYFPDGSERLVRDEGSVWQDNKIIFFTTGARPETLEEDQIAYSYPLKDQAYFLKGETNSSNGLIKYTDRTQQYLFKRTIEGKEYVYVARFRPVSGGDPVEGEVTSTSRGISFRLPDLENEAYYAAQIVRKPVRTLEEQITGMIGTPGMAATTSTLQPIIRNFNLDGSTVRLNLGYELPGNMVRSGETLLYSYYFRTSRYNTLSEKLASMIFEAEKISSPLEMFRLTGDIPEKFEEYDLRGYYKGGIKRLEPLVQFRAPFTYSYHTVLAAPNVYDIYQVLTELKRSDAVLRAMPLPVFNSHRRGLPPTKGIDLSSGNDIDFPLQDWEIEREARITRSSESASTGSTSTTGGTGISTSLSGGSVMGFSNPGVSGLFGGTTTNIFSAGSFSKSLSGSSTRTYNLELLYTTSVFVKLDATSLKQTLGRIVSYRDASGRDIYTSRLISRHPSEFSLLFNAMRTNLESFNYTSGSYGVSVEYYVPTLESSGSQTIPNQSRKSGLTRTFNY